VLTTGSGCGFAACIGGKASFLGTALSALIALLAPLTTGLMWKPLRCSTGAVTAVAAAVGVGKWPGRASDLPGGVIKGFLPLPASVAAPAVRGACRFDRHISLWR
jgi:hypothetical protein